jgi:hypothetical protein
MREFEMNTKCVEVPVPPELAGFFRWPPILASESPADYKDMFTAVASELRPQGALGWLFFKDILESIWETRRWKNAKAALVDITRMTAVRQVLESIAVGDEAERGRFVAEMTEAWFGDAEEKSKVALLLQKHGFRMQEVDAQAMAIRLQDLELMDRQLARARAAQMTTLRELEYYRGAGSWRQTLTKLVDVDRSMIPLAPPAEQSAGEQGAVAK